MRQTRIASSSTYTYARDDISKHFARTLREHESPFAFAGRRSMRTGVHVIDNLKPVLAAPAFSSVERTLAAHPPIFCAHRCTGLLLPLDAHTGAKLQAVRGASEVIASVGDMGDRKRLDDGQRVRHYKMSLATTSSPSTAILLAHE